MRYLLLLILCCFSSFLYGQSDFAMIDTLVEQGQLDQAVERLTVLTENTTPETTAGAWQRIGSIRREQSDYNGAIEALQQAEDILKKASPQSEILPNVYYQLAAVYSEIGDVEKALNYLNQQIALSRQIHGELSEATGNGYLQMTKIGYQLGDWEMAREGALKVLDIYQSIFPADHIKVANAYNNAGLTYELGFNEYEKALDYYQKALAIKKSKLGEEHPSTNKTLINIAYIYRKVKKDYATALQLYQQNLSVLRKRYGEKQTDVAVAYYTLASTYLEMEEADSALYYAQRAMVAAHPTFESLDYKEEPRELPAIVTDYLIDILGIKAGAFALRFKQQGAEKDLQRSLEVHQAAIEVALQIRDYFRSSAESKLILQEYLYPLYEQALEVAYQGWSQFGKEEYLKAAFRFMEQSKSLLLNQAFRQVNASAIAQVPASIKEK
ncbi:MAG: tetratricopeptide repeat protein, partial [Saprospiraceae bacterium]|nr:tetratricopeptide repeat protein [Saprospiraceae bacterium]